MKRPQRELPDPDNTRAVYERQALRYDTERSRQLVEAVWLERFSAALPERGRVLDLGCGGGEPITSWLIERGFRVTGVDSSEAMLAIARARWPGGDWRHIDMRDIEVPERFDGIIAWDSFFHLTAAEQTACISRMSHHLVPGGHLLLTVGPDSGEGSGTVGGESVYHASLSPAAYVSCLEENGLRLTAFLAEDPDAAFHSVLMSQKRDLD